MLLPDNRVSLLPKPLNTLSLQRKSLRERLIAGYQANAAADIEIAAAWSNLEDEALLNHIPTTETQDTANDSASAHPNSAR